MKNLLLISFATLMTISAQAQYSYDIVVRSLTQDAVVLSEVHLPTATYPLIYLGYKNSGNAAKNKPGSIDAVVTVHCLTVHSEFRGTRTFKLDQKFNEGYLSRGATIESMFPECRVGLQSAKVAFSDGQGNWDSRFGQDYDLKDFTRQSQTLETRLGSSSSNAYMKILIDSLK